MNDDGQSNVDRLPPLAPASTSSAMQQSAPVSTGQTGEARTSTPVPMLRLTESQQERRRVRRDGTPIGETGSKNDESGQHGQGRNHAKGSDLTKHRQHRFGREHRTTAKGGKGLGLGGMLKVTNKTSSRSFGEMSGSCGMSPAMLSPLPTGSSGSMRYDTMTGRWKKKSSRDHSRLLSMRSDRVGGVQLGGNSDVLYGERNVRNDVNRRTLQLLCGTSDNHLTVTPHFLTQDASIPRFRALVDTLIQFTDPANHHVNLSNCSFSDKEYTMVADVLRDASHVTSVDFSGATSSSVVAQAALLDIVSTNRNIVQVRLETTVPQTLRDTLNEQILKNYAVLLKHRAHLEAKDGKQVERMERKAGLFAWDRIHPKEEKRRVLIERDERRGWMQVIMNSMDSRNAVLRAEALHDMHHVLRIKSALLLKEYIELWWKLFSMAAMEKAAICEVQEMHGRKLIQDHRTRLYLWRREQKEKSYNEARRKLRSRVTRETNDRGDVEHDERFNRKQLWEDQLVGREKMRQAYRVEASELLEELRAEEYRIEQRRRAEEINKGN